MRRVVVHLVAAAVLVAACGGSDSGRDSSSPEDVADAIFDQLMDGVEGNSLVGEREARCIADGMVEDFGVAGLSELGLTLEAIESGDGPNDVDLSDAQSRALDELLLDCVHSGGG